MLGKARGGSSEHKVLARIRHCDDQGDGYIESQGPRPEQGKTNLVGSCLRVRANAMSDMGRTEDAHFVAENYQLISVQNKARVRGGHELSERLRK